MLFKFLVNKDFLEYFEFKKFIQILMYSLLSQPISLELLDMSSFRPNHV